MNPDVNKEGRGLGLAICEAIVAKNKGIIEVQSFGHMSGTLVIFSMSMKEVSDTLQLFSS